MHEAMAAAGARVGVCYPLIVAEQPVGALYVYRHEEGRFSDLELLLLDNLVNLAALAIHREQQLARAADYAQRIQRNLERKEDELARMRRADLLISSRSQLQDTLESILQMALEVTDARYGILRLVDESGGRLLTRALAGDDLGRPAIEALPLNTTSITGWVAKTRDPLCITDVHAEPWARIYYPLDHEREMRSELAVPLIGASGRLEGVINLESPLVGAFSEDDSLLLQSLATQAVIAIQEVRLLDALQEIAERLLTQPLQQVLDRLVELARQLLGAPVGALWTLDEEDLVLQSANAGHVHGERVALRGSLTGQAVLQRGIVIADDVRHDPRFQWQDLARRQGWTQALIAPLLAGPDNEAVGALSVYNTEANPGQFLVSDWDKKVLTFLAHHAALAVRNAAHQEALRREREQRAAAETFAAVGDIAANLLHRLNNKIGVIPVRVEGIQDKCQASLSADPYLAANLAAIERSAAEAMEALSDSLFYLRPIRPAAVDIGAAVAQAISSIAIPAGIRIHVRDLDALPTVIAGQQRLSLVFVNLLENAIAAMQGAAAPSAGAATGEIHIRGAVRGGWVEVTVSDTGPGIAPELHEKIFEFNYSGAKRANGQFGFGLWWVRTLMARFGGGVTVESDGRRGATFTLRLPIHPPQPGSP
jgi:signal transduction histidine kinase